MIAVARWVRVQGGRDHIRAIRARFLFATVRVVDETKGKKSVLPRTQFLTFSEVNLEGFSVLP
jgi:hypothetical protein